MDLAQFKERFDPRLANFLKEKQEEIGQLTSDSELLEYFGQAIAISLAGGKRIRPYVAYLMYKTIGGKQDSDVLELLIGCELLHLFCLLQDDVMDKAHQRHGQLSLHRFIGRRFKEPRTNLDRIHLANSQAMLIGDIYLNWAHQLFDLSLDFTPTNIQTARHYFSQTVDQVVVGQMIDLSITARRKVSRKLITEKMVHKTAEYSFIGPMCIGAALGGMAHYCAEFCQEFGYHVGLAYQIQDDYLDLVGDAKLIKKGPGMVDLSTGQLTYFTDHIQQRGTTEQKQKLRRLLGHSLTTLQRRQAVQLFTETGALVAGQREIEIHLDRARQLLKQSSYSPPWLNYWYQLIDLIASREA